jgi:hypothetical protein
MGRAALIYAALAVLLVSPALPPGRTLSASDGLWYDPAWRYQRPGDAGSNPQLGDSYYVFQPFLQRTRATLPHIPLWNPNLMAGRPFLANGQSAIFSPFSAPAYVLPFWRSLALIAALKLFVAAFGAYLLGAALGMRFPGALLTGIVFAFSLWFVVWLSWPTTSAWALLPWLWLCADRLARRADLLGVCALAVVVALQFLGGHPESSFHVLAATAVFFALRLPRRPALLARLAAFAGAIALGAALAALTLLPLAELLHHSADRLRRETFADLHTPPRYLLGLFLHDFWGRPTRGTAEVFGPALHTRAYYVGALTLMLAPAALVLRRTPLRIALAAIAVICLAIAVGTPPFPDLLGALPGFKVSNNSRLVVVFVLCVALLAGWGLDDLVALRRVERPWLLPGLGVLLLVTPLVWMIVAGQRPWAAVLWDSFRSAWLFQFPDPRIHSIPELERLVNEVRTTALWEWALPAAAGVVLIWLRVTRRLAPAPFAALAIALIAIDLLKTDIGMNPAIATADAVQPTTPAIRQLRAALPYRFSGLPGDPLHADVAMRYGLLDARGYDFPIDERFFEFWRTAIAAPGCGYHFCSVGATATPRALHALGVLSVARLLAPSDQPRVAGLPVVYSGPDGRVYANPRAAPRTFMVSRQRVLDGPATALAGVTDERFDPASAAITEERIPGVDGGSAGSARLVDYRDEHVTIEADTPQPGVLVLTDSYAPGWKATVDGTSVPIHRVDYLLRGVEVGAGRHRVEFSYEPAAWRTGLIVSGVALAVLIGFLLIGVLPAAGRVAPRLTPR